MYSCMSISLFMVKTFKMDRDNWHGRLRKHCIGLKMYIIIYILFHQVYNQPILVDPNSGKIGRKAKQGQGRCKFAQNMIAWGGGAVGPQLGVKILQRNVERKIFFSKTNRSVNV